jgi:hypothetical protein
MPHTMAKVTVAKATPRTDSPARFLRKTLITSALAQIPMRATVRTLSGKPICSKPKKTANKIIGKIKPKPMPILRLFFLKIVIFICFAAKILRGCFFELKIKN